MTNLVIKQILDLIFEKKKIHSSILLFAQNEFAYLILLFQPNEFIYLILLIIFIVFNLFLSLHSRYFYYYSN